MSGRKFWKMSGSGNDFVVFDSRGTAPGAELLEHPVAIEALCARGTGVGADGVVFVADAGLPGATLAMRYYNSDGSRGAFCGNATLCVTSLAAQLGLAPNSELTLEIDSGLVPARIGDAGPEIYLPLVSNIASKVELALETGESLIGFVVAGVPHLVVRCADVQKVDVEGRGWGLRHSKFREGGANVNFVSERGGVWSMRTFERGVEGETLACGSGAVATAVLLAEWKESGDSTSLITRSGMSLRVRLRREEDGWRPTLGGQGRIVFTGEISDLSSRAGFDLDAASQA